MRQELKLETKPALSLSPLLKLSLEVLQKPLSELTELLIQEASENPLIEIQSLPELKVSPRKNDREERVATQEKLLAARKSVIDYYREQLPVLANRLNSLEMRIAEEMINSIDEMGFLKSSVEGVASALGVHVGDVEKVRQILMRELYPRGCCARNFLEALAVQIEEDSQIDESSKEKLKRFLNSVQKSFEGDSSRVFKFGKLSVEGFSDEEVDQMLELLKRYSPFPGSMIPGDEVDSVSEEDYAYPEATVEVDKDGNIKITFHREAFPKIRLNKTYEKLLNDRNLDEKTRNYLKEKARRVKELEKALSSRERTIVRVIEKIVEKQRDFFLKGPSGLRPLNLRDVSQELGIHESTVSRAIAGKFLRTPYGVFSLKYFFPSSLGGEDSSEKIKAMIKELIENEDPSSPLSDGRIARILRSKGIDIARRTVSKYRAEMGIPSSSMRKASSPEKEVLAEETSTGGRSFCKKVSARR